MAVYDSQTIFVIFGSNLTGRVRTEGADFIVEGRCVVYKLCLVEVLVEELWKNAQWDGTTGITQDGDLPWIWLVNIDHLYWVKDGLQVAEQKLHPHGHGWSIVNNVDQWTWK